MSTLQAGFICRVLSTKGIQQSPDKPPSSWSAALHAAGAVLEAVDQAHWDLWRSGLKSGEYRLGKLTYPTWGKGTSSSNMPYQGDMLIPWRVTLLGHPFFFGGSPGSLSGFFVDSFWEFCFKKLPKFGWMLSGPWLWGDHGSPYRRLSLEMRETSNKQMVKAWGWTLEVPASISTNHTGKIWDLKRWTIWHNMAFEVPSDGVIFLML